MSETNEETSLRDDVVSAMAEIRSQDEPEVPETPEPETQPPASSAEAEVRARDPSTGRFVRKEEGSDVVPKEGETPPKEADTERPPDGEPEAPARPAGPPNGWSAEAKAEWHKLSDGVRAAISQRELDIHKHASTRDENATFGKSMSQALAPFMPLIQSQGVNPAQAVASVMQSAAVLQTGTPEQKRQALENIARNYNIPLPSASGSQVISAPGGQPHTPPAPGGGQAPTQHEMAQMSPAMQQYIQGMQQYMARLEQSVSQLDQRFSAGEQQREQALKEEAAQEVDAFRAAPGHDHYDAVKGYMSALIRSGQAGTLQDAYDQACWADPNVRATLQAQQRVEEEQKRRQEKERKAAEARSRNVSLTGAAGTAVPGKPNGTDRSLRDEIAANFAAARDAGSGGV